MLAAAAVTAAAAAASAGMKMASAGSAKNPYGGQAPAWLSHLPELYKGAEDPYREYGMHDLAALQAMYHEAANDPSAVIHHVMPNYHETPGYEFAKSQGIDAADQAAAAGGMVGSPAEQAEVGKYVTGYADQHYEKALHDRLGLYGEGIHGLQGISDQGFHATQNYVHGIANYLNSRAHLGAAATAWTNQRRAREYAAGAQMVHAAGSLAGSYAESKG